MFVSILNACKYFLKLARKDYRFRDVAPSAVALLAQVKARVCFYLPLLFKRLHSLHVAVILFHIGVPVVLWYLLGMVSWLFICESSVAY